MFDLDPNRKPMNPIEIGQAMMQIVDFADYFARKLDQYERDQRYDDNQKKLLVQALRMYEKGDLNKDGLKAIIDLLPDAVPTKVQPASPNQDDDLAELLKRLTK